MLRHVLQRLLRLLHLTAFCGVHALGGKDKNDGVNTLDGLVEQQQAVRLHIVFFLLENNSNALRPALHNAQRAARRPATNVQYRRCILARQIAEKFAHA